MSKPDDTERTSPEAAETIAMNIDAALLAMSGYWLDSLRECARDLEEGDANREDVRR